MPFVTRQSAAWSAFLLTDKNCYDEVYWRSLYPHDVKALARTMCENQSTCALAARAFLFLAGGQMPGPLGLPYVQRLGLIMSDLVTAAKQVGAWRDPSPDLALADGVITFIGGKGKARGASGASEHVYITSNGEVGEVVQGGVMVRGRQGCSQGRAVLTTDDTGSWIGPSLTSGRKVWGHIDPDAWPAT